jgi:type VI secretion system protein ImpM
MIDSQIEVGFYGKLPFRGDFLHRRVPGDFVDAWDAWLQQCLHSSRQQLGDRWLDAYLTSPVWRFVFAEGVCGTGAYAGIFMPSVDRVGRYFPLTITAQFDAGQCALDVACSATAWFDSAENLALRALEATEMDIDQFDAEVGQLSEHFRDKQAGDLARLGAIVDGSPFPAPPASWHVPLSDARSLQRAVNLFAARELSRSVSPMALWWSDGSQAALPGWLTTQGLPDATVFAAMLTGEWSRYGWTSLGTETRVAPAAPVPPPQVTHTGSLLDDLLAQPSSNVRPDSR